MNYLIPDAIFLSYHQYAYFMSRLVSYINIGRLYKMYSLLCKLFPQYSWSNRYTTNEMIICVRMAHLMKADHNLDIKMNKLLIASTAYNGTNVTPA